MLYQLLKLTNLYFASTQLLELRLRCLSASIAKHALNLGGERFTQLFEVAGEPRTGDMPPGAVNAENR